jgi:hypothetical protein
VCGTGGWLLFCKWKGSCCGGTRMKDDATKKKSSSTGF